MRNKQLSLFKPQTLAHGGDLRVGKRKLARPVDPKRPLHVVMRSSRAQGPWSLLKRNNSWIVNEIVYGGAKRFHIRVYEFANVGNHLHFLIQGKTREGIQNFLRYVSGQIAFRVTNAKKGEPIGAVRLAGKTTQGLMKAEKQRFWDSLAFSRVVSFGKEFDIAKNYLITNLLEAKGLGRWQLVPLDKGG